MICWPRWKLTNTSALRDKGQETKRGLQRQARGELRKWLWREWWASWEETQFISYNSPPGRAARRALRLSYVGKDQRCALLMMPGIWGFFCSFLVRFQVGKNIRSINMSDCVLSQQTSHLFIQGHDILLWERATARGGIIGHHFTSHLRYFPISYQLCHRCVSIIKKMCGKKWITRSYFYLQPPGLVSWRNWEILWK